MVSLGSLTDEIHQIRVTELDDVNDMFPAISFFFPVVPFVFLVGL
jgi:hypothetical protein